MMATGLVRSDDRRTAVNRAAIGAAVWSFGFGAISFYWALGGTLGIGTLAQSIQEDARSGDRTMLVLTWLTGGLKLLGGLLMLSLVQTRGARMSRRIRLLLGYLSGAVLTLYGVAGFIEKLLMELGMIDVPDSLGEGAVRWYLFLWEPVWLLGGALYLLASRRFQLDGERADR